MLLVYERWLLSLSRGNPFISLLLSRLVPLDNLGPWWPPDRLRRSQFILPRVLILGIRDDSLSWHFLSLFNYFHLLLFLLLFIDWSLNLFFFALNRRRGLQLLRRRRLKLLPFDRCPMLLRLVISELLGVLFGWFPL